MSDFVDIELRYNSDAAPVSLDAVLTLSQKWTSISYSEGVDQPFYKWDVKFTGQQTRKLFSSLATKDLHCILKINGIPMAYGFHANKSTLTSQSSGTEITLHFETFCSLLQKQTINPHQVHFTGMEPISAIIAQLIKMNAANTFQVILDPSAFKITYNSSTVRFGIDATYDSGVKPIGIKELQPKPDESVFTFLQRVCRRHGYLMRDSVTSVAGIVQPCLIIAPPRALSMATLESTVIDAGNRNAIVSMTGQFAGGNVKVIDVSEKCDQYMPLAMFGYGVSYNPDVSLSSFKCCAWNELLCGAKGYGNPAQTAEFGVSSPIPPDPFLLYLGKSQRSFQTQYVVIEKKIWTDAQNLNEVINRTAIELWSRQNQAYQLDYTITQHDKPPILSDDFAYVQDDYIDPITSIYYVQNVTVQFSKDQGYVQKVGLRIPNTFRVGNL